MAKTYDEYEVDEMAKAKKRGDDYAAQRKAQADEAVATSDSLYDNAIATAEKIYAAAAKETDGSYRGVYDTNAVTELVSRRNVEEAMANMGMTDSGLNRTQQTAISLQRGRADTETTRQKQAAVDAIMRELDNVREQYNTEKLAASRDIYAQADNDILTYRNNADAAARQNAASLYAADQEFAAKQAEAGKVYNAAMGGYVKQEASTDGQLTNDQIKLALDYMDKTGTDYKTAVKDLFGDEGSPGTTEDDSAVVWARTQIMSEYDFNRSNLKGFYGSYQDYAKRCLTELYNRGKIDDYGFYILAGELGVEVSE